MIDKQYLEAKLLQFKNQFIAQQQQIEQLKSNLSATNGAIQLTQHFLSELERMESEAKEVINEVEDKL